MAFVHARYKEPRNGNFQSTVIHRTTFFNMPVCQHALVILNRVRIALLQSNCHPSYSSYEASLPIRPNWPSRFLLLKFFIAFLASEMFLSHVVTLSIRHFLSAVLLLSININKTCNYRLSYEIKRLGAHFMKIAIFSNSQAALTASASCDIKAKSMWNCM